MRDELLWDNPHPTRPLTRRRQTRHQDSRLPDTRLQDSRPQDSTPPPSLRSRALSWLRSHLDTWPVFKLSLSTSPFSFPLPPLLNPFIIHVPERALSFSLLASPLHLRSFINTLIHIFSRYLTYHISSFGFVAFHIPSFVRVKSRYSASPLWYLFNLFNSCSFLWSTVFDRFRSSSQTG